MSEEKKTSSQNALRQKAEKRLKEENDQLKNMSAEDLKYVIHELQVHKIELEMQNEQLEEARNETEKAFNKYSDLFNLAPVAYLILNKTGVIIEANATSAQLFDTGQSQLINKKISDFLKEEWNDVYYLFFRKVYSSNERQICEVELFNAKKKAFYAQLISIPETSNDRKERSYKVAVINTTDQKKARDIIKSSLEEKERLSIIMQTQEQERKRIAEALHNGVGQVLYAIKIKADQLLRDHINQKEVKYLDSLIKEVIDEIKSISYELVPTILEDFGLETVIQKLCRKLDNADIKYEFSIYGYDKRLELNLEISIFRIVQELVNNVIRHSLATRAEVFLTIGNDIVIRVEDNGVGFKKEPAAKGNSGMGLRNIQNRVQLLNGTIDQNAGTGAGTSVVIRFPLVQQQ